LFARCATQRARSIDSDFFERRHRDVWPAQAVEVELHQLRVLKLQRVRLPALTLDRLDPVLPLSPGRAERHGFEYYRHGTLSLYAALDTKTGKVHGKTSARHTSADFVAFLSEVVSACKANQEIHIILDNLSTHKTNQVEHSLSKQSSEASLHADVFFLAQSGGNLVREAGARSHRPRHLYIGPGSLAQTHALYPSLFENRAPLQMEILQCPHENPSMLTNSLQRATSSSHRGTRQFLHAPCPSERGVSLHCLPASLCQP